MVPKAFGLRRLVLVVSILASFVAFLDASVVNVALPAIARNLGGGLATQQWVVDAYLLTLGSLILIAGSLSDVIGRKAILTYGLIGFGAASLLCALAPTSGFLIAARAVQGAAGALLVPSSLALIIATFPGKRREGRAIGIWTGWTGIAYIVGPLVGGFLVDAASWRWVFAINIVPIAITLLLMQSLHLPHDEPTGARVDVKGAALCALGLAGTVYALIEQPHHGWTNSVIWLPFVAGLALLGLFVWVEHKIDQPMLPLGLFHVRNFSVGNLATATIYAGLSASFIIVVFAQQTGHYSAFMSGLALLPVTIIMFFLSSRFGALAGKFGPRFFMAAGPLLGGAGFLLMLMADQTVRYWTQLLPGVLLFGLGLSMTVAPLTAAILGSIAAEHAGIGSAVNNAVARVAGLIAVAAIGLVTGPKLNLAGFHRGLIAIGLLLFVGAIISAIGIQNSARPHKKIQDTFR